MVSVGGLASGMDTAGIIDQLSQLERRPIAILQSRITQHKSLQAAFTAITTRLSDLRNATSAMGLDQINVPKTTISDDSVASISAKPTALSGSHDLVVHQLAAAHRIGSQAVADATASPISTAAGNFTVQAGSAGAQITVAVSTATTLNDLASAINAAGGDVSASVVNDGTAGNAHRLVLTSKKTGTANGVQVTSNPTTLDFANPSIEAASSWSGNAGTYAGTATSSGVYTGTTNKTFLVEIMGAGAAGAATYRLSQDGGATWDDNAGAGFSTSTTAAAVGGNTEGVLLAFSDSGSLSTGDRFTVDVSSPTLRVAADASFTLDGIRQTRSTNSVGDAIEGVSIDLKKVSTTAISFGVDRPTSDIVSKVDAMVEAYNKVYAHVRDQQKYDADTQTAGALLGDATANAVLNELRRSLSATAGPSSSRLRNLLDLGIKTGEGGKLTLDKTKLEGLLNSDREGVMNVLASRSTASTSSLAVATRPPTAPDGSYGVNVTTAPQRARIAAGAPSNGALAQPETLTFTYSRNNNTVPPNISSFTVGLTAGQSLGTVIDRLNSTFATQGAGLRAFSDAGVLTLESTDFGSDVRFTVQSNTAAGAGTTQFGTSSLTALGVDVVGTIDGQAVTGLGSRLTVPPGGPLAGLALTYSGNTTGAVGNITLTTGAGSRFTATIDQMSGAKTTLIGGKNDALNKQIESVEKSIARKETQASRVRARLEKQFANMEVSLAGIQAQGNYLVSQLNALFS